VKWPAARSADLTMLSSFSEQLLRQSLVPRESTIPPDLTIAPRVVSLPATPCNHLHDTTTRYEHAQKLLTFLLVCPVCGTEKIVDAQHYEPRFQSSRASELADAGATMQALPVRRDERPMRRAA
jgi:hypothetical protein